MSDITQDIESRLLGSGQFKRLIFPDVEFKKSNGRFVVGECPHCKARGKTRPFHASTERAVFQCKSGSCQWGGGTWHNWQEYTGKDWLELYQELARHAGVTWPESSEAVKAAYESRVKRSQLLEDFYSLAVEALARDEKILKYWDSRGYNYELRQKMGLAAYPGARIAQERLLELGYSQEEISESGLVSKGFEYHPALYLLRDKRGAALGLMGRAIEPEVEPKYFYQPGISKRQIIVGIDEARGRESVVLIESPLGSAYLNAREFVMPVIGLGGATLSSEQLQALQEAGVRRFVLALDNDEAGAKATEKIIKQLQGVGLRSLMVARWQDAKGLDDLHQADPAAAEEAILSSVRAAAWMATNLLSRSEFGTHIEQEIFFEAAAQQFAAFEDGVERKDYKATIENYLQIEPEVLNSRFDEAYQRIQEKRTKKGLESLLRASLSEENPLKAAKQAQRQLDELLREARGVTMPEPYLLATAVNDILNSPPGLELGFASMAGKVKVPRAGLSIIAAQSGVGKTTLMLNLLSNWLELAGEQRFYFYSYEEPKSHIMLKLVMIWAGVELHPELNFYAYINYLSEKRDNQKIEAALERYEQLASSGRLIVDDSMPAVEDLAATLARLGDETGAVVLDYVQRIPSMDVAATRQLELAYITQQLRKTAVEHNLAIVTGSQLNDEGKLREARDIYHEAALVLELFYPTPKKNEEDEPQPLTLKVEKQRAGRAGITTVLGFNKPVLKMIDIHGERY